MTWLMQLGLFIMGAALTSHAEESTPIILFEDPLDGSQQSEWKSASATVVKNPTHGGILFFESAQEKHPTTACWIGDEQWKDYAVEYEVMRADDGGGFIGLDFHVQNDGEKSCNIGFYMPKEGHAIALEHAGRWNAKSAAWKHWPYSKPIEAFYPDQWMKIRLETGEAIANVFINDATQPVYTIYDLPFSSGGIRFWEYHGSAYYRNLKVTNLASDSVKPILDDLWKEASQKNIIKDWQITPKLEPSCGQKPLFSELDKMTWKALKTDRRGIANLIAEYPDDLEKGCLFAKTTLYSDKAITKKAWISYTDRITVWLDQKPVFKGLARGFSDPGRSDEDGFGRILPDLFEFELPLNEGNNEILVCSELTEPLWGWAFWMRIEQSKMREKKFN